MSLKQSFTLAIKSLMSSKMRSILTMLGIIIGIASVIILTSLMNGITNMILDQFSGMGTELITVNISGRGGNRRIEPEEIQALIDENPDVFSGMSPMVSVPMQTVKYKTESLTSSCTAVSEAYKDIRNLEMGSGRFLEYIDVERRQKNCVIGSYQAKELFDGENPIGQALKIGGATYNVIGVLEEQAESEESSSDDIIYIPYTTARLLTRNSFISTYAISAVDTDKVDEASGLVEKLLLKTYTSTDYFSIIKQTEVMDMINEITGTMTTALVFIAGISLLVGGIGIMNIMLVSVTERTREIGIRKSLGARRFDILSQFVVEAATSSAIGGVLGIIIGIIGALIVGNIMDITAVPTLSGVLLSFGVSAFIGVAFGYFPANKASKLNPIDALRYD